MTLRADWPGEPFQVDVDQAILNKLRDRLLRTRFLREQAGPDWATGTPLNYARRLRDYWLDQFDRRVWERAGSMRSISGCSMFTTASSMW